MHLFTQHNNIFALADKSTVEVEDIESGVYRLKQSMTGLYLEKIEDNYLLPPKIYGNPMPRADRILQTWRERKKNTGLLLSGDKGSGKTLLSQILCNKGIAEDEAAVVLISLPIAGQDLTDLLAEIKRPLIICIDEFEKIYNREKSDVQKAMLTMMDGSNLNGALFVLTVNDQWAIDSHMLNRPGRIYYHYRYAGLDEEFIRSYCEDKLDDKTKIDDIIALTVLIDSFSFDILQAIVEELNRYNEPVGDVLKHLNIKTYGSESEDKTKFVFNIYDSNGNDITSVYNKLDDQITAHPMRVPLRYPIALNLDDTFIDDDDEIIMNKLPTGFKEEYRYIRFPINKDTLVDFNRYTHEMTYKDPTTGFIIKISSSKYKTQSVYDMYLGGTRSVEMI